MTVSATELKYNIGKYLKYVDQEDIGIKKNGKLIAVLTSPYKDKLSILQSLEGILPNSVNEETLKNKRLIEK